MLSLSLSLCLSVLGGGHSLSLFLSLSLSGVETLLWISVVEYRPKPLANLFLDDDSLFFSSLLFRGGCKFRVFKKKKRKEKGRYSFRLDSRYTSHT